jgi:hypothetical protein
MVINSTFTKRMEFLWKTVIGDGRTNTRKKAMDKCEISKPLLPSDFNSISIISNPLMLHLHSTKIAVLSVKYIKNKWVSVDGIGRTDKLLRDP